MTPDPTKCLLLEIDTQESKVFYKVVDGGNAALLASLGDTRPIFAQQERRWRWTASEQPLLC